jgi:hypothetical protein
MKYQDELANLSSFSRAAVSAVRDTPPKNK